MKTYLLSFSVFSIVSAAAYYSFSITQNLDNQDIRIVETDSVLIANLKFANDYAEFFEEKINHLHVPGAALVIVKDSTVLFMDGFGVKKVRSRDSIDVHTLFRIGSLSKGFASIMTGILEENGHLSFDDRVNEYLPYFKLKSQSHTNDVTIKHLLSHTTGLPYHAYTNLIERGDEPKDIAQSFKTLNLIGEPGEIYAYQNAVYALIHNISSIATNDSYEKLLHESLLIPNGMVRTSANYQTMKLAGNKAFPHKYDHRRKKWRTTKVSKKYYNAIPAGGINSSIEDMSEWLKLLMGYKPEIIQPSTLDKIFAPIVKTKQGNRYFGRWNFKKEAYYGMGWRVVDCGQDTIIYHGGYVNEYRAEIAFSRKDNIGICALFNSPSSFSNECVPTFWKQYYQFKEQQDEPPLTVID